MESRAAAVIIAFTVTAVSLLFALFGAASGFGLRCDDSCDALPTSWRHDVDAWQWPALGWAGLALLGCALVLVAAAAAGARRLAWTAALTWVVVSIGYAVLLLGFTSHGGRLRLAVVAAGGAAPLAAALVPRRRGPGSAEA